MWTAPPGQAVERLRPAARPGTSGISAVSSRLCPAMRKGCAVMAAEIRSRAGASSPCGAEIRANSRAEACEGGNAAPIGAFVTLLQRHPAQFSVEFADADLQGVGTLRVSLAWPTVQDAGQQHSRMFARAVVVQRRGRLAPPKQLRRRLGVEGRVCAALQIGQGAARAGQQPPPPAARACPHDPCRRRRVRRPAGPARPARGAAPERAWSWGAERSRGLGHRKRR